MSHSSGRSVTLLELLIAIALISLVVLGFSSIDLFSRYHVSSSDKRAQMQNEVAYVLAHMSKEISKAIGNLSQPSVDVTTEISSDDAIKVWIDGNPYTTPAVSPNGKRDDYPSDRQIAYRYRTSGSSSEEHQVWFYAVCNGADCNQDGSTTPEVLSMKITNFAPTYNSSNNYVEVQITACYDPTTPSSSDNPEVTMKTRILMPSVSTN